MSIRKLNFPDDLDDFYNLIIDSFQYPENPEWNADQDEVDEIKDTVNTIRKIWPLYRMISWMSPALRDALLGFIWEEDGKPVGMVSVGRRGNTDSWVVGNVAVLPEYRRRGIARKLVETGLDFIRQQGGTLAVLSVIDGNLPAYKLYESLGFEHYTSTLEMLLKSEEVPSEPKIPAGYQVEPIFDKDWELQMELAKQVVPLEVQAFDPIVEARYKKPTVIRIFMGVMNKMQGVKIENFAIRDQSSNHIIAMGFISAQTRSRGRHRINLTIKPEYEELVPFMLQTMLHKVKNANANLNVEAVLWKWRYFTIEAHEEFGFERGKEYFRMGLKL